MLIFKSNGHLLILGDGMRTDSSSRSNHQNGVDGLLKTEVLTSAEKDPWWKADMNDYFNVAMVKVIMPTKRLQSK